MKQKKAKVQKCTMSTHVLEKGLSADKIQIYVCGNSVLEILSVITLRCRLSATGHTSKPQ